MLTRRERAGDAVTSMIAMLEGFKSELWTALPGQIQSFDPTVKTAVVQVTLLFKQQLPDGSLTSVKMSQLVDCPVIFPSGGGATLTFPIKQGDECLMIFSARAIDAWWQNGGTDNVQVEQRYLDLSDGFCLPGCSSVPNVQPDISTTKVELRTNDNQAKVTLDPASHEIDVTTTGTVNVTGSVVNINSSGNIGIVASGTLTLTGASIAMNGPVTQSGGGMSINGVNFASHKHTGVRSGTDQTGGVVT